jgi:glycosyltransferase involved in cell wall biosynthesis/SAM-dependent methyltransferase
MICACTIIASNYLAFARVLADSFFAHHAGASFTVLLVDDEQRELEVADPCIDWRRLRDIGLDRREIHRLAGIYDVTELSTAVKPLLLRQLLEEGRSEVIYLDPDIRVYDSLADVTSLARQFGIVLTPHTMDPLPKDGRQVDDLFILAAGVYNLGFIAVGADSRPFLDWWWQSTRREALVDVKRMMFTDQRWIDFAPSLFHPHILKDPGCNVAYWNLHARNVTRDGDQYFVNGVPLRFFHFSGFEVQQPWLLSRHQGERPRVLLSERPVLARICQEYACCLQQAGLRGDVPTPRRYGWRAAAAGFELNARMRRLYWDGLRASELSDGPEPPDPFDSTNAEGFLAWLNAPDENGPRRVSRYLYSIYCDRSDLQIAFPEIHSVDAARFADWVRRYGAREQRIPPELMPPHEGDETASKHAAPPALAEGLSFVGYFRSEMGIGEAARLLKRAADVAEIPHSTIICDNTVHRQRHPFDERPVGACPYDINILCVNADETSRFARSVGPGFFAGRHTVGYWFWEVDPLPDWLYPAFDHVDEVWTATDYVAEIIRAAGRKPVFTVPIAMPVPVFSPEITRERLGLPRRFLFLFLFDFLSVLQRKNPLGLIDAFTTAFSPDEGPVLVIKSINGSLRAPELEQVRMAAAGRPDILVVDRHYSAEEKNALLGACDCYVSLHRSEGLGLTLAEAMALGKPVIATGYSGNLHFMTPDNSYLVDYTLSAVPPACGPYPTTARWAAPDLGHAARLLRMVYERPFDVASTARRGQADILDRHGSRIAGAALARRIDEIRRDRRRSLVVPTVKTPPATAVPEREKMVELPAVTTIDAHVVRLRYLGAPRLSAEGRTWPSLRLAAQRALFRLIRPYWFQQRQFQDALIQTFRSSIKTLVGEVATLTEAVGAIRDASDAQIREFARTDGETKTSLAALSERLFAVSCIDGQERFIERAPDGERRLGYGSANGSSPAPFGVLSAESLLRARQRLYPPLLAHRARVLDIGCGRGGMLDLLRVARIPTMGIDVDPEMVRYCRANGHVVVLADPLQFLREQADGSVGAIFSARLIERLPFEKLQEFFRLCRDRLEAGGLLIAETASPRTRSAIPTTGAHAPATPTLHPEVALTLCQHARFEQARVLFLSGVGDLDFDRNAHAPYAVVATAGS